MINYVKNTVEAIRDVLPEEYIIASTTVNKVNGVELQGITITNGSNISPVFYLNDYFNNDFSPEETAKKIVEQYIELKKQEIPFRVDEITNYETMRDKINFRIINAERNEKLLSEVPFDKVSDDLVCIYYLDIGNNGTVKINNSIINQWGIDRTELMKAAIENSLKWSIKFSSLTDIILEIMNIHSLKIQMGESELSDDEFKEVFREYLSHDEALPVFVLCSDSMFGASVLLRPDVLEKVKADLGSDFIIIPSSQYEVLVVSAADKNISIDDLRTMVCEVNKSEVRPDEQLSDNVYYCNGHDIQLISARTIDEHIQTYESESR